MMYERLTLIHELLAATALSTSTGRPLSVTALKLNLTRSSVPTGSGARSYGSAVSAHSDTKQGRAQHGSNPRRRSCYYAKSDRWLPGTSCNTARTTAADLASRSTVTRSPTAAGAYRVVGHDRRGSPAGANRGIRAMSVASALRAGDDTGGTLQGTALTELDRRGARSIKASPRCGVPRLQAVPGRRTRDVPSPRRLGLTSDPVNSSGAGAGWAMPTQKPRRLRSSGSSWRRAARATS